MTSNSQLNLLLACALTRQHATCLLLQAKRAAIVESWKVVWFVRPSFASIGRKVSSE